MKKLKSIIIENDSKSLSLLKSLISDYCPELEVVSTSTNIQDSVKQILNQKPDLIFLDIELNDGLGFDVLNQIPDKKFKTIIISGFSTYACDAYKFEVVHYLLKPVSIRDLRIAIDRILSQKEFGDQTKTEPPKEISLAHKKIQVSTNKGTKLINVDEIESFKADGSYTIIYFLNKESIMASKHMKNYEFILSEPNFYRIGRTYIINLDCVKSFNKRGSGTITMANGTTIVIPRRKKDEFFEHLDNYLQMLK